MDGYIVKVKLDERNTKAKGFVDKVSTAGSRTQSSSFTLREEGRMHRGVWW
mgnify:CR=1 FL=1